MSRARESEGHAAKSTGRISTSAMRIVGSAYEATAPPGDLSAYPIICLGDQVE